MFLLFMLIVNSAFSEPKCDGKQTLDRYYAFEECLRADRPDSCSYFEKGAPPKPPPGTIFSSARPGIPVGQKTPISNRYHGAAFLPGEYVMVEENGQKIYGQVQSNGQVPYAFGGGALIYNPFRGTSQAYLKGAQKVSRQVYEQKVVDDFLSRLGIKAGATVQAVINGKITNAVIGEANGTVYDHAQHKLLLNVEGQLVKVELEAIKNLQLKRVSGFGLSGLRGALKGYTKLTRFLNQYAVAAEALIAVVTPTEVGCAELVSTVFEGLDTRCRVDPQLKMNEFFKSMDIQDQAKLLQGSEPVCKAMKKYLDENLESVKRLGDPDFTYALVECREYGLRAHTATNLFPRYILGAGPSGYEIEQRDNEVIFRTSPCKTGLACSNPPQEIVFASGAIRLNGETHKASDPKSRFRQLNEDLAIDRMRLEKQIVTIRHDSACTVPKTESEEHKVSK